VNVNGWYRGEFTFKGKKDPSRIKVFNNIDFNGISNLNVISKNQKDIT